VVWDAEEKKFKFKCVFCSTLIAGYKVDGNKQKETVNLGNIEAHFMKNHCKPLDWTMLAKEKMPESSKKIVRDAAGDVNLNKGAWSLADLIGHSKSDMSTELYKTALEHFAESARAADVAQQYVFGW
jgi:hypothetical protein